MAKAGTAARQRAQAKYNSKPEQVKNRANRNAARAKMVAAGRAHKGDGKDVAHLNNNTNNNAFRNLAIQSQKKNRSFARTKNGHRK
jgi:hypothetical protein